MTRVNGAPGRWIVSGLVVVLAAVAVGVWLAWPSDPAPRERQYRDATACLLTDAAGVTGVDAAPVWAGMQDASLSTLVKVQYQAVDGPQTSENVRTQLNGLARSRCDIIVTVGAPQVAAGEAASDSLPGVRFVSVGGRKVGANISTVEAVAPDSTREAVRVVLTEAFTQ